MSSIVHHAHTIIIGSVLSLTAWTIGYVSFSERPVIRSITGCGELQKEAMRISAEQVTESVLAVSRMFDVRSVTSKDLARYSGAECRARATLSDGSTIFVGFHYGQDDAGTRVYVLERYDGDGNRVAVQSAPRGEVEYGFVPPTSREHGILLLGVAIVVILYVYARTLSIFWWE